MINILRDKYVTSPTLRNCPQNIHLSRVISNPALKKTRLLCFSHTLTFITFVYTFFALMLKFKQPPHYFRFRITSGSFWRYASFTLPPFWEMLRASVKWSLYRTNIAYFLVGDNKLLQHLIAWFIISVILNRSTYTSKTKKAREQCT